MPLLPVIKSNTIILKVVNPYDEEAPLTVNLDGKDIIAPMGEAIVLTSASAEDTNSLENPLKVVPVTTRIPNFSNHFHYILKPHSLTFLRLKVK